MFAQGIIDLIILTIICLICLGIIKMLCPVWFSNNISSKLQTKKEKLKKTEENITGLKEELDVTLNLNSTLIKESKIKEKLETAETVLNTKNGDK